MRLPAPLGENGASNNNQQSFRMRSLRDVAVLALLRLRPSEWQKTLAFAGVIGVLGALATIGFRQFILLVEQLAYGHNEGLVRIATGCPGGNGWSCLRSAACWRACC